MSKTFRPWDVDQVWLLQRTAGGVAQRVPGVLGTRRAQSVQPGLGV
jgi:hypothetical protein